MDTSVQAVQIPGLSVADVLIQDLSLIHISVKGLSQWNKNNHCPRLSVTASVVSKRTNVSRHSHPNAGDATGAHGFHSTTSTSYYATFQVESGDRMELSVTGTEYGLLAEGDRGKLTFQGTRYLGFERLGNVEPV